MSSVLAYVLYGATAFTQAIFNNITDMRKNVTKKKKYIYIYPVNCCFHTVYKTIIQTETFIHGLHASFSLKAWLIPVGIENEIRW